MTSNSEARKRREERETPHTPTPASGTTSDGQHCETCRAPIWRKGVDEWAHVDTADYIRSEAERLPNGTAAKFIAALDALDGATNQKGRGAEVSGLSEGEGCREGGES